MLNTAEIAILLLNVFELSAAVTGFFCWKKLRGTPWAVFPLFLMFIFITEIVAKLMRWEGWYRELISPLYKFINIPLSIFFILFLLSRSLKKPYKNGTVWLGLTVFGCVLFLETLIFSDREFSLGSPSYLIGCILILITALLSFYNLLFGERILNFKSRLDFWVSIGVLVYYIPSLPFNALKNTIMKAHYNTGVKIWYVTMGFDCLMYGCFIAGFILFDRNKFDSEYDQ